MKYSYAKIRKEVYKISKTACFSRKNVFKSETWDFHILPVVELSLELGRKLGADREVLELAALLHDHASVSDLKLYKNHHIHGAREAGEILKKLNFPDEKIKQVQKCIKNHRGSVKSKRTTIEEKILASADAMSHFTNLADMFYLTFHIHQYRTREGALWLKRKLARSWKKIMPEGREMIKNDRAVAFKILNKF